MEHKFSHVFERHFIEINDRKFVEEKINDFGFEPIFELN